jgi:hypothetical protein
VVDDLLLLARVDDEAVSARVRRAPVDLSDLVGSVVARGTYPVPVRLRPTAEHGRGDASVIHGDGDALVRVIGNLLDNAARHARTEVVVDLGRDAGPHAGNEPMVSVTITDDGPGIPEAERDRSSTGSRGWTVPAAATRAAAVSGSRSCADWCCCTGGSVVLEDADPGLAGGRPAAHGRGAGLSQAVRRAGRGAQVIRIRIARDVRTGAGDSAGRDERLEARAHRRQPSFADCLAPLVLEPGQGVVDLARDSSALSRLPHLLDAPVRRVRRALGEPERDKLVDDLADRLGRHAGDLRHARDRRALSAHEAQHERLAGAQAGMPGRLQ